MTRRAGSTQAASAVAASPTTTAANGAAANAGERPIRGVPVTTTHLDPTVKSRFGTARN